MGAFRAVTFAGIASLAIELCATGAHAAMIRSIRASASDDTTSITVEVDGQFSYRRVHGDDPNLLLVDIDGAIVSEDMPRVVAVADSRVDGIVVLCDRAARIVRLSIDIAGRVAPKLEIEASSSRLVLGFADADGSAAPARDVGEPVVFASPEPKREPAPRVETRRNATVRRALVVLDPGHGGKDPGAKAWTGEHEKDIVLDLAERVARRLRKDGRVDVVMTRSEDHYVELADRRDTSKRWGADLFVSIHANASHSKAARGIETYSFGTAAGNESAEAQKSLKRLARQENRAGSAREGSARAAFVPASLKRPILTASEKKIASVRVAGLVQDELVRSLGMRYEAVRDLGAKQGPFFVLRDNAAPSILVEAAFLTHREEGIRMRSEVYREQIAEGVARGILAFFDDERRPGAL